MPRPEFNGAGVHQSNPLKAFIEGRKNRKERAAEAAAKEISNDTAKNEMKISDTLGSIDFLHSRINPDVLNKKTNPKQPCGDLEWAMRAIRRDLMDNPQPKSIDIRKIDEKILQLAVLFKQSVEQGDQRAAYASKAALVRAVHDIRNRVPSDSAQLSAMFVETNAKYLDSWITLVNMCQVSDRYKENADNQEKLYNETKDKLETGINDLWEKIEKDPVTGKIFTDMIELDEAGKRTEWSNEQVQLHTKMIERAMDKQNLAIRKTQFIQLREQFTTNQGKVDTMYSKVANMPIVTDPNLMNKFQEEVDNLVYEMAKADQEIDETLSTMERIEGALKQLEDSAGNIRVKELAVETANAAYEEIQDKMKIESGNAQKENQERLGRLGIKSQEEVQILKEQAELQQALELAEMLNTVEAAEEIAETSNEALYN